MKDDQKPYKFMKETIKQEPPDWKKYLLKLAVLFLCAALAGLIAAAVFAFAEPRFENLTARKEEPSKIDIPGDEEKSTEAVSANSQSTIDASETDQPKEEADPVEQEPKDTISSSAEESDPAQSEDTKPAEEVDTAEEDSLKNYQKMYQDMLKVTEQPKRALVTVIGITNQMDYFNQNYENQQQISGLIVAENEQDLFILTEYRIVENVERIQVTFWNTEMVDAVYQRYDPGTGLAVIKVDVSSLDEETKGGLEIAPLGNSYGVDQGDPILALGSPIGYSDSVAYGVVTSVTNKISTIDTEYNLLTTDILGSSDGSGVLVNLDGEIVGVIAQRYSAKGNNVVTGIAISQIKKLIENLSNNVSHPYIGIRGQDVTEEISGKTGIPKGVLISEIADDSPAMMAGMKEYDVIVKIGEEKITTIRQYHDKLEKYSTGETITVSAMRKGAEGYAEMTFEVTVGEN